AIGISPCSQANSAADDVVTVECCATCPTGFLCQESSRLPGIIWENVTVIVESAGAKLHPTDRGSQVLHLCTGPIMERGIVGGVTPFSAHRRIHDDLLRRI